MQKKKKKSLRPELKPEKEEAGVQKISFLVCFQVYFYFSEHQQIIHVQTGHKQGLCRAGQGYNWDTMEEPILFACVTSES